MKKILSSTSRIRFQDCDPYNHLNNAKYIDYMINAREDQILEHYDLDIFARARNVGKAWVVASNQIAYLSPAFTMETVIVESQVINYNAKGIQVEIRMWNEERTDLKSFMWVNFVHYDLVNKAVIPHDDFLMELFSDVFSPVDEEVFDERFKALKKRPQSLVS
jgi:thioesterase III